MPKNFILFSLIPIAIIAGVLLVFMNNDKTVSSQINIPSPTASLQSAEELKIEDIKIGEGQEVKKGDTISIHYVGTLLNGTKFDSSVDRGTPFETVIGVGDVIKGWDEGVIGMKVGGKRKLTIPAFMAYGEQGAGSVIPPNSTLIFELELLGIK